RVPRAAPPAGHGRRGGVRPAGTVADRRRSGCGCRRAHLRHREEDGGARMTDVPVTDVHAHVLLPSLHAEVERRAPEGVAAAAALELKRHGAASQAVSGPMVGARVPKLTDVRVRLAEMD